MYIFGTFGREVRGWMLGIKKVDVFVRVSERTCESISCLGQLAQTMVSLRHSHIGDTSAWVTTAEGKPVVTKINPSPLFERS